MPRIYVFGLGRTMGDAMIIFLLGMTAGAIVVALFAVMLAAIRGM